MGYSTRQVMDALMKTEYAYDDEDRYYYGRDFNWGEFSWGAREALDTEVGVVRVVDQEGGEGQGDHAHIVFQVKDTGQYFRIDGYYSSYEGTDWDGELREVHRVTREVVFYE